MSAPTPNPNLQPAAGNSASSQSAGALPKKCTYNLDRFLAQNVCADGSIASRLQTHTTTPHPTALVPFHQTRAASTIAAFDAAFNTGAPN